MDDDCMPTTNALEELLVYADALDGAYGWLSSKVLWKDGGICAMNVQRHDLTHNITDFSGELIAADLAKISKMPLSVITALGAVVLPKMSAVITNGRMEEARKLVGTSVWFMLACAFALAFGIVAVAEEFLFSFLWTGL